MPDPEISPSTEGKPETKPWMKFAGTGMELAGTTLGLAAIGYAVDRYRNRADGYGVATGALIGFAFGMYRLIRQAMQEVNRQTSQHSPSNPHDVDQDPSE